MKKFVIIEVNDNVVIDDTNRSKEEAQKICDKINTNSIKAGLPERYAIFKLDEK